MAEVSGYDRKTRTTTNGTTTLPLSSIKEYFKRMPSSPNEILLT